MLNQKVSLILCYGIVIITSCACNAFMTIRRNGCIPPVLKQENQHFNDVINTATISTSRYQGQYTFWFVPTTTTTTTSSSNRCLYATKNNDSIDELRNKADQLRVEAEQIRQDLETKRQNENQLTTTSGSNGKNSMSSPTAIVDPLSKRSTPWNIQESDNDTNNVSGKVDYRLYVDIGREMGTWMDPRWGASGRRIEFSIDVRFTNEESMDDSTKQGDMKKYQKGLMVNDNWGGTSSSTKIVSTAKVARLRNGFDEMKCTNGEYRIDGTSSTKGSQTLRFYILCTGTPEQNSLYGDLFIPNGPIYFSIPIFGSITQLSRKEGPVTVRQVGWHTGWRREESRIIGTFKALPMSDAKKRDGF